MKTKVSKMEKYRQWAIRNQWHKNNFLSKPEIYAKDTIDLLKKDKIIAKGTWWISIDISKITEAFKSV